MPQTHPRPYRRSGSAAPLQVPPSRITRCVREMLAWRAPFDATAIVVESDHGVVTLRGAVSKPDDAREARRLARSVLGVTEVRDLMVVTGDDTQPT